MHSSLELGMFFKRSYFLISILSYDGTYATWFIVWNFVLETLYGFVFYIIKVYKHCLLTLFELGN